MSVLGLDIVRQFSWQWNLSVANYAAFQLQKSYSLAGCNVENAALSMAFLNFTKIHGPYPTLPRTIARLRP